MLIACAASGPTSSISGTAYATTVTSAGPINPAAIPLGDGYVSTTPKVGYVDSCQTSFGGIGGAQVDGPGINTAHKFWDSSADSKSRTFTRVAADATRFARL